MCIYTSKKFCVYLTTYRGNKLPPFYIGSSTVQKVENGYKGSVRSKKYSKIWKEELSNNPHLFSTKIICTYYSRKMSLHKEKMFQIKLDVVKSTMYINESIACINGMFGRDVKKELHPLWGVPRSEETKRKVSENHYNVSGANNPRARTVIIEKPNGEKIKCFGTLRKTCVQLQLSYSMAGKLLKFPNHIPKTGSCVGYKIYYI